ncbi:MAG: class A beta-lactamase-related serine hydrolase [Elusimicrobiales bacterium]|nr:class A beta-lactamase-related serine hydrolase [Elusimicrobiales bacterium]
MQQHHDHQRPRHLPAPAPGPRGGGFYRLAGKLTLALLLAAGGGFAVWRAGQLITGSLAPEPEPRKVVESPIRDAEWLAMVAGLEKLSRSYSGRVGIYIKDLETGKTWDYNSKRQFPSASLIKVPIMAAIFEKIKAGQLSLDTQIRLTRSGRVGGSGSLKWVRDGTSLSVMEIIYKMITESDNTATKMLIDAVGMDYLAAGFRALGLERTNITPEGMSLSSRPVRRENYTTAREMGSLLERIYAGELVSREASEFMLDVLKHTKSRSRLRKGLPLGWEIGHKTGLLRRNCHDVGIVFSPRGDFVIAVLTSEAPNYTVAKNFIAKVAKLTYQYYKIDSDYAGLPGRAGAV